MARRLSRAGWASPAPTPPTERRRPSRLHPTPASEIVSLLSSFDCLLCRRDSTNLRVHVLLCHHFIETLTKVLEHDGSGITPRTTRNRAARMRGGPCLVKTGDRH